MLAAIPLPYHDRYLTFSDAPVSSNEPVVYTYLVSELLYAFMFMRIGFLIRSAFNYT